MVKITQKLNTFLRKNAINSDMVKTQKCLPIRKIKSKLYGLVLWETLLLLLLKCAGTRHTQRLQA